MHPGRRSASGLERRPPGPLFDLTRPYGTLTPAGMRGRALKCVLNPRSDPDGGWIALRYQNGREKSSPKVYKSFLMATAGFAF